MADYERELADDWDWSAPKPQSKSAEASSLVSAPNPSGQPLHSTPSPNLPSAPPSFVVPKAPHHRKPKPQKILSESDESFFGTSSGQSFSSARRGLSRNAMSDKYADGAESTTEDSSDWNTVQRKRRGKSSLLVTKTQSKEQNFPPPKSAKPFQQPGPARKQTSHPRLAHQAPRPVQGSRQAQSAPPTQGVRSAPLTQGIGAAPPSGARLGEKSRPVTKMLQARSATPTAQQDSHEASDASNESADLEWRKRARPKKRVPLPSNLSKEEVEREVMAKITAFERKTGARIVPTWDGQKYEVEVFGDDSRVQAACRHLHAWSNETERTQKVQKKPHLHRFGKISAFVINDWRKDESRLKKVIAQQQYKQAIPEDGCKYEATFRWELEDIRPEEALGRNFQVLDAIRTKNSTFIEPVRSHQMMFKLAGSNGDSVQRALQELQDLVRRIESGTAEIEPETTVLNADMIPGDALVQTFDSKVTEILGPNYCVAPANAGIRPQLKPAPRLGTPDPASHFRLDQEAQQRLQDTILEGIRDAKTYNSKETRMNIGLGHFVLSAYPKPNLNQGTSWSFDVFNAMLQESQPQSWVSKSVCSSSKDIMQAVLSQTEIFCTGDPFTPALESIKPVYLARFTFSSSDADPSAYCLENTFRQEHDGTGFYRSPPKWSRIKNGKNGMTTFLDSSVIDLDRGAAWQFAITATDAIHKAKVPEELRQFEEHIRLGDGLLKRFNPSFQSTPMTFPTSGAAYLRLKSWHFEKVWELGVVGTQYTCEIKLLQSIQCQHGEWKHSGYHWSCSIINKQWDSLILSHGDESPAELLSMFFPDDDSLSDSLGSLELTDGVSAGLGVLLKKLAKIQEVVFSEGIDAGSSGAPRERNSNEEMDDWQIVETSDESDGD